MAYSLSDDPRRPLPSPLEGYRQSYEEWAAHISESELWVKAQAL
jgi:hypothetical protein